MNSIQKEREAFEAHIKSTYPMGEQLAKDCGKTLCELYSSEWEAWQAAKAQAVPEGFVLMPKEPSLKVLDRLFMEHLINEERATYIYKDIIDAQEQSHESK